MLTSAIGVKSLAMSNGRLGLIAALVMLADDAEEQRVAVLGRAGDEFGGQARAGARLALDHELLAEDLAQAAAEHARGDVAPTIPG